MSPLSDRSADYERHALLQRGLGKAVVSTPYWHAQELLSDGCGVLVPFASPDALAKAVSDLLGDGRRRDELRRSAYQAGRAMTWPVVGGSYLSLFAQARLGSPWRPRSSVCARPSRRRQSLRSMRSIA
jgi:hypothetical protein